MLTAISQGRAWAISNRAAQEFILDNYAKPKDYHPLKTGKLVGKFRRAWETKDKKVYAELLGEHTWCLVARHDPDDLLRYIKYKLL
jgi:hypothetical protein